MQTLSCHTLCADRVIPQQVVTYLLPGGQLTNYGPWNWATVVVNAVVPGTLTFTAEISHDGVNWFPCYVHALNAAQNKWVIAANLAVVANTQAALFGLSCPAPYVRIGAIAAGAADATLTAHVYFVS